MSATTLGVVPAVVLAAGLGSILASTVVGVVLALVLFGLYYRYVLGAAGAD